MTDREPTPAGAAPAAIDISKLRNDVRIDLGIRHGTSHHTKFTI